MAGVLAQDDRLLALLETMGDVQRQQVEYLRHRRDGEREARFKITRNIPKITAEGGTNLLDEFYVFIDIREDQPSEREGLGDFP